MAFRTVTPDHTSTEFGLEFYDLTPLVSLTISHDSEGDEPFCNASLYERESADVPWGDPEETRDSGTTHIADGTGNNAPQAVLDLLLTLCADDARLPRAAMVVLQRIAGESVVDVCTALMQEATTPGPGSSGCPGCGEFYTPQEWAAWEDWQSELAGEYVIAGIDGSDVSLKHCCEACADAYFDSGDCFQVTADGSMEAA